MKQLFQFTVSGIFLIIVCLVFTSCKKSTVNQQQDSENARIESIRLMGFDVSNIRKLDEGYLVEGDIMLTEEFIRMNGGKRLDFCSGTPLVSVPARPRIITIRAAAGVPASVVTGLDGAIAQYNAIGFGLRFQRVTSGGNIVVSLTFGLSVCAASGFPTGGNPYHSILISSSCTGQPICFLRALLFHEIGHCIGVRHTDGFNPAISCGGSPSPAPPPAGCNSCSATDTLSIFNTCLPSGGCPVPTACDIAGLRAIYP